MEANLNAFWFGEKLMMLNPYRTFVMNRTCSKYLVQCFVYSGIQVMTRAQTKHPLDPLSATEISVAVATVRAAGTTPEV